MTDPNEPDSDLDDSALDRALNGGFAAAGDDAAREAPTPTPSVIERIAQVAGARPSVSLREVDGAGQTPILKPLAPGERAAREAGKYMVQGMLGQGGVGAVHKGHDTDLGRDVAMKFLHEKYKDEPAILHRFVEEAQIGGQLQHPGIVPVYELGMADGRPFFTMKMVKGQTLAEKLARRAEPSSDRRTYLAIFEDICQTMAYAHARGVVHRDLKPSNVMIGAFGEVQVVDWGMGKVLERGGVADERRAAELQSQLSVIETVRSAGHGTQSIVGSVMGTPAYMPPEQARGDVEAMDARSDVFALGAILCELLTGQPPYVGEPHELIGMAAMARLDDARERLAGCGAGDDLIALATACLTPAPTARPQSAEAVAKAVHDHLAAAEQRAHDATVRSLALKRTQKLGIALTAVIAAGLAASLWFWRDADTQRGIAEQAAASEQRAREQAVTARDAAQANLANFNRLSHVVRLETAKARERELFPAGPAKVDALQQWLADDADALLHALPELRGTLAALEVRSLPQTDEQRAALRDRHPRAAELRALEGELAALQRARAVRSGAASPSPPALPATPPTEHRHLNNLAWALAGPDRALFGREAEGLALARLAAAAAPERGDERAMVGDTLAWALFANGLDEEARTASSAALAAASPATKADHASSAAKLEAAIAAAAGSEGQRALDALAAAVAELDAEVSAPTDLRFEDPADEFLHTTLRTLVTDIESFRRNEVADVTARLRWSRQVEELTVTRHRAKWDQARLAILRADGVTASELYGAVPTELAPQVGLVPLGMNPVTRLWEFYHLRSAWDGASDPASIAIPTHREDGSIPVEEHTGVVFVLLPGATFTMGSQKQDEGAPNYDPQAQTDEPLKEVELEPFFLARHELTQGQWARLWTGDAAKRRPCQYGPGFVVPGLMAPIDRTHPVEQVSWEMCDDALARHGLMMPSEAAWEYGCRANTTTPFWCDAGELKSFANVADATAKRAGVTWSCEGWEDGYIVHAPVDTFGANAFGMHGVHGNVMEWCRDSYNGVINRVHRGGSYLNPAGFARSAFRGYDPATFVNATVGVRVARVVRVGG